MEGGIGKTGAMTKVHHGLAGGVEKAERVNDARPVPFIWVTYQKREKKDSSC